ncbi:MAG: tRNA uracil 4-sulfurtransferase ThiI [Breznakia sp.]
MNTQANIAYDHILIRFGELSTKGKNKKDFIRQLFMNVKRSLQNFSNITIEKGHDRLYILLHGEDHKPVCEQLQYVFGISSYSLAIKIDSDLDTMVEIACQLAQKTEHKTFKMDTRRHHKAFLYSSDEINRACASKILQKTELRVDVKKPELRIQIEVREFDTYVMTNRIKGAGGYPVGTGGKAMVMLSGGIDSPVACYEMQKRGVVVECVHFASPPYTSQQSLDKVKKLASRIALFQGHVRLHIITFTDIQLKIYENCPESYAITIMRRMMYRLAECLCEKQHCLAIVNGESLGQVASQTLESMNVIGNACNITVLRPLACRDKLEIIKIAENIGTYQTSILPFEDCCTIFTPKKPTTKPKLEKAERFEAKFDFRHYLEEALLQIDSQNVYVEKESDHGDLF